MKVSILGYAVDNLTMAETIEAVRGFVASRQPHQHVVINADKVVKAHSDQKLKSIIDGCDLINADGMSVVWASRLLGSPLKERVAGIDLFINLLEESERSGWGIYLLGAKEEVLTKAVSVIKNRHPRLRIVGARNGYWNDDRSIIEGIKSAHADILFVGMSSPQKEFFVGKYLHEMGVPFVMGVGGSIDVVAGKTKRAPLFAQRSGLEWFYRFIQEPGRMWKKYLVNNTMFCYLTLAEMMNKGKMKSKERFGR